ncbi:hypothetical protein [Pandoraea sputorum]|nr:hypothetical protein [Pandoraea sputorum]
MWQAHHALSYTLDLSHDLPMRPPPVATPVEFTRIMAEVRAAHERPPPVATPVEFTQIMAEVRAAHERPPPVATPVEFTQIMAEVRAAHERPPPVATPVEFTRIMAEVRAAHDRPPPVATPVEFTRIMAEVRAAHERPPPVATPVEFTRIMANVRAAHEAQALRSDGVSWQTTSPRVPRAERNLTPADSDKPRSAAPTATRRRCVPKVTGELLRHIEALGASGVAAEGGIGRIADEHGIARSTLKGYVSESGKLYSEARDRAAETGTFRTGKVTVSLLRTLEMMGAESIQSKGGLRAIARNEGIPFRTLVRYVDRYGKPSLIGRARLRDYGDPTRLATIVPVTPELLRSIQGLGESGIRAAGGLSGLAERHNVFLNSLRSYINSKGVLGRLGKRLMKGERRARISKIPNKLLLDIEALGARGISEAGGLGAVAAANHVAFDTLRSYIDCRGRLTPGGRFRLYGADPSHTTKVTPTLLRELLALGKDGIASEGGLDAVASKRRVAPHLLRYYVTCGGKLKRPGRVTLERAESNTSAQSARDATVTAHSNAHKQA